VAINGAVRAPSGLGLTELAAHLAMPVLQDAGLGVLCALCLGVLGVLWLGIVGLSLDGGDRSLVLEVQIPVALTSLAMA